MLSSKLMRSTQNDRMSRRSSLTLLMRLNFKLKLTLSTLSSTTILLFQILISIFLWSIAH